MNKRFRYYALIWVILLIVFNVICFVTPNEIVGINKFNGAFWTGYVFITLAFIGQLICAYFALYPDDKTKLFYNIPLIRISYSGLILTVLFGALCMVIPYLPNWIGIITCTLVLAFTAISVIKANAASDIVESIDTKVKAQTLFVKSLMMDAESLFFRAKVPETKNACKKVFEAVRYSDPMSNDALSDIESQIRQKFDELSNAVNKGSENVKSLTDELVSLIGERNRKCRLMK